MAAGEALTENEIGGTMEDILNESTPGKASKSLQFEKPGGNDQANADFDSLTPGTQVTERENGLRTAELSNGTKVNVRPFSSGNLNTLEVATPGNPVLKVRYGE